MLSTANGIYHTIYYGICEGCKAVNSLLHFSSGDQEALLEVMEEFFCTPSQTEANDSDLDDDSDNESVDPETGIHEFNVITTTITH